jgi:hypothetical protein
LRSQLQIDRPSLLNGSLRVQKTDVHVNDHWVQLLAHLLRSQREHTHLQAMPVYSQRAMLKLHLIVKHVQQPVAHAHNLLWQLQTIFLHMQWLVLQREREPVQLHMSGLWLQEFHLHVHHPHMQAHSLALRLPISGM